MARKGGRISGVYEKQKSIMQCEILHMFNESANNKEIYRYGKFSNRENDAYKIYDTISISENLSVLRGDENEYVRLLPLASIHKSINHFSSSVFDQLYLMCFYLYDV